METLSEYKRRTNPRLANFEIIETEGVPQSTILLVDLNEEELPYIAGHIINVGE